VVLAGLLLSVGGSIVWIYGLIAKSPRARDPNRDVMASWKRKYGPSEMRIGRAVAVAGLVILALSLLLA